ncbi:hypothetical protein RvY_00118, partial [Ramazzottius varieornatus]
LKIWPSSSRRKYVYTTPQGRSHSIFHARVISKNKFTLTSIISSSNLASGQYQSIRRVAKPDMIPSIRKCDRSTVQPQGKCQSRWRKSSYINTGFHRGSHQQRSTAATGIEQITHCASAVHYAVPFRI